jgi:hypothetical protein
MLFLGRHMGEICLAMVSSHLSNGTKIIFVAALYRNDRGHGYLGRPGL